MMASGVMTTGIVVSNGNRPDLAGLVYAPIHIQLFKMPKSLFDRPPNMTEEMKRRAAREEWSRVGSLVNFRFNKCNVRSLDILRLAIHALCFSFSDHHHD